MTLFNFVSKHLVLWYCRAREPFCRKLPCWNAGGQSSIFKVKTWLTTTTTTCSGKLLHQESFGRLPPCNTATFVVKELWWREYWWWICGFAKAVPMQMFLIWSQMQNPSMPQWSQGWIQIRWTLGWGWKLLCRPRRFLVYVWFQPGRGDISSR